MAANKGPVCLSVINMKGGVGKTTVAALLSRYASQRWDLNRKVLAVDLDPQANLSQALKGGSGYRRFLKEKSLPSSKYSRDTNLQPAAAGRRVGWTSTT